MKNKLLSKKSNSLETFSLKATKAAGSTSAFMIAVGLIVTWGICGPIFHFSPGWHLIVSTSTTIITFLMVFLIQRSQNKDSLAIQLKLNELVAAHEFASNRLVDVENMTEEELRIIQKYYAKLSLLTKEEEIQQQVHSIDETHEHHNLKEELEQELRQSNKK